ncbi:hypothetical protein MG293_017306 [Ovis ammon polii]|uniref:Uncharacterized protein n=1 Tax=Ovis ammon polii TaxID=230172 RepID=A0AAD4TS13_OVIAM|nr:hypothetical protein MG293_017306 [Ovis ammon polii]
MAEPAEDDNNNVATAPSTEQVPSPGAEAPSPGEEQAPPAVPLSSASTSKRTNLKKPNSERTGHGLRVRFNPLALLLDASLEGEFDLVQRVIYEVEDPSKPNDGALLKRPGDPSGQPGLAELRVAASCVGQKVSMSKCRGENWVAVVHCAKANQNVSEAFPSV